MADTAYVGVGSNLGDRPGFLRRAVHSLEQQDRIAITARSSVYESPAVGYREQPDFLNAAVSLQTDLSPRELMEVLLAIETSMGRTRDRHWGPRTIDLDLLLYGDRVVDEEGLVVPHPRLLERGFVLLPLGEIDPLLRHPVEGRPLTDYARACNDGTVVSGSLDGRQRANASHHFTSGGSAAAPGSGCLL